MTKSINVIQSKNKKIMVHKVDISHVRLVELSKLADQAKPFYDWIERRAKNVMKNSLMLEDNIMVMDKKQLSQLIEDCYFDDPEKVPLLFDGVGRNYPHNKACFYFFAWIIRDAPQQRLAPLISRMKKQDKDLKKIQAEIDALAALFIEYRQNAKYFKWESIREVVIDRLEGSRRSISGHVLEANIRAALATAFQNFYSINIDYGIYDKVEIKNKQISVGSDTIDVSADLIKDDKIKNLFIPVKSRETEGGGHSHLFSRDIITAVQNIKSNVPDAHIAVVIVATNWANSEIESILKDIDIVFHFDMNPNELTILDDDSQRQINIYIEKVLKGEI
ncbi:hypothetical protein EsVE80_23500 [Enterococcus saigonensis]|uniref:Restriction endonuclease n=1 Tax=Enterococcus saigonensis TaxID=1805431 RepID=A0A679ITC2_9ENTE|nr:MULTISPECIES: hypothetical protein [Enterococcus]BCA86827.1 hypothetical protein EsVE80_23500 [Enterococcus saigonensis]